MLHRELMGTPVQVEHSYTGTASQLTAVKMAVFAKPVTEFTDLSGNKGK